MDIINSLVSVIRIQEAVTDRSQLPQNIQERQMSAVETRRTALEAEGGELVRSFACVRHRFVMHCDEAPVARVAPEAGGALGSRFPPAAGEMSRPAPTE